MEKCNNKNCPKKLMCKRFDSSSKSVFEYTLEGETWEIDKVKCDCYLPSNNITTMDNMIDMYYSIRKGIKDLHEKQLKNILKQVYAVLIKESVEIKVYKYDDFEGVSNFTILVNKDWPEDEESPEWDKLYIEQSIRLQSLSKYLPWYSFNEIEPKTATDSCSLTNEKELYLTFNKK